MSKAEATQYADLLLANWPHDFGRPVREGAAALLRRWPDGEPVAQRVPNRRGRHDYWDIGETVSAMVTPENLYTAPPDQSERIAALEAALKVAQEALTTAYIQNEHDMLMTDEELRACNAALRAIEEAQR